MKWLFDSLEGPPPVPDPVERDDLTVVYISLFFFQNDIDLTSKVCQ